MKKQLFVIPTVFALTFSSVPLTSFSVQAASSQDLTTSPMTVSSKVTASSVTLQVSDGLKDLKEVRVEVWDAAATKQVSQST